MFLHKERMFLAQNFLRFPNVPLVFFYVELCVELRKIANQKMTSSIFALHYKKNFQTEHWFMATLF